MKRGFALTLALLLLPVIGRNAHAGTITYTVDYYKSLDAQCNGDNPFFHCIPNFSFSFETNGYVTTTGMFDLASPVTVSYGPGTVQFTRAGTNNLGYWLFGGADEWLGDPAPPGQPFVPWQNATSPYLEIRFEFRPPDASLPYYQTWPGPAPSFNPFPFGSLYPYVTGGAVGIIDGHFYTFGAGGHANVTLVEGSVPDTGSSALLLAFGIVGLAVCRHLMA